MAVSWNLVHIDRLFGGTFCLHLQGDGWLMNLMMDAARSFESSVSFYQTTLRSIPEDIHLQTRRLESLKSHLARLLLAI